jgi:N-sulfoglucosamine sulfohydrolase
VDELYDLENDPWELVNRVEYPVYSSILKQLRGRMAKWMKESGDPLISHPWGKVQLLKGRKL